MASENKPKKRRRRGYKHRKFIAENRHLYDELFERQGGRCALCPSVPKRRRLALDHDHKRMVIRGLLCTRCNRALPSWITKEWLLAAADYVEREA